MEMMDTNWQLADHQGGGASGPKVALMTPQVFGVGGNGRLAPEGQLGGQKSISRASDYWRRNDDFEFAFKMKL